MLKKLRGFFLDNLQRVVTRFSRNIDGRGNIIRKARLYQAFLCIPMKTRRKLLPGQPGTKKLLAQYGDDLVCVRYRYDVERKEKVKTVELIIARDSWQPDPRRIPQNKLMPIRVEPGENALRQQIKAAGGRWNRKKRVWELPYKEVIALGLTERIMQEED